MVALKRDGGGAQKMYSLFLRYGIWLILLLGVLQRRMLVKLTVYYLAVKSDILTGVLDKTLYVVLSATHSRITFRDWRHVETPKMIFWRKLSFFGTRRIHTFRSLKISKRKIESFGCEYFSARKNRVLSKVHPFTIFDKSEKEEKEFEQARAVYVYAQPRHLS